MKNHTDVMIFHTQICAGASQICLMADANLKFASPRRVKRSGMEISMSMDREWNQTDSREREKAERLFCALSGVDEELVVRSEEKTSAVRVVPFWKYSRIAAACLCVAVLGVAYWALSEIGIIGGNTKNMNMSAPQDSAEYNLWAEDAVNTEGAIDGESAGASSESRAETESGKESAMNDVSGREQLQEEEQKKQETASLENAIQESGDIVSDGVPVFDWGPNSMENVEALTLAEAKETENLGAYVPDVPQGYVLDNAHREYVENNLGEKNYYSLYLLWRKGMDDISIHITQLDTKTEHLYRETLTDINNEESYNCNLYEIPYGETVPKEYREVFDHPVFAAEDMSLEIVKARMKSYNDSGDTGTPRGNFSILYQDGILLEFRGDCDAETVWNMLKDMAQ